MSVDGINTGISTSIAIFFQFFYIESYFCRCREDPVDVIIILDTSTSVEKEFYAEKEFALDLIKVFPQEHFTVSQAALRSRSFFCFTGDVM